MRLTIVALFVVFAGLAYAADMQPAGTAESEARAEQAAAAQAERDAARAAKEAAERRAALEEAERRAAAEAAERAAREEAERQATAEAAERAAREEAERQAAERAAREEAERQAAERAARAEAERQAAAEAAERAAREEAERQAAAEAAERAAREEAERQAAERAAREEAERQAAAEAAERAAREEAERQAAAERAAREEAERQAAAERAAREEAERQAAAEAAERAAKQLAEREAAQKAASEASGQAAQATVMSLGDMDLAGSAAVCNLSVTIRDEAAAKAIADRARSDAEAHAAAPAQLIIVVRDSVASLASAYALDQGTVSRAYFNGICQKLAEMGARLPLALGPLLANLADTLGVTYRPAKGVARLTTQPDSRPAPSAETAQDDSDQPLSGNRQPRQASPGAADSASLAPSGATPEAGEPDVAAAASPDEAEERGAPAANGDATPPGGSPESAASGEGSAGDAPQPAPMATPAASNGTAPGLLGEAECRALGVLGNCPDLNAVFEQLLEKPLEYNHPGEMLLGRNTEISLVLRTDWEGDELPKAVSEEFKDLPGEVKQGISKITRIMSAELSGRSFDIRPSGNQERSVVPPQPVSWRWQVKPTETGKDQTLRLRLYAHLQGPQGTMPPILVKTLDATINVDVTPWDWMVSQARTLEPVYAIGAALIGLLTAILTFLLARRRREAYADGPAPEPRAAHTGPDPDGAVTDAGPVIGDVSQSAADSRPPAAPPAAEAEAVRPEPPPAEDGSETPPDNDSGPKTS